MRYKRDAENNSSTQKDANLCTYSIGIGEVSSISQPAAEVVVRASSA